MNTVHNARITLLATALNNLALAVVVAGFIAPFATGQAGGRALTTLAWIVSAAVLHFFAHLVLGRLQP